MSTTTRNRFICLFGPTGTGKTDFLFDFFPGIGEIISVDSIQIYKHLNIGSAKPSLDQRKALPHHLVDILDPKSPFSVGQFLKLGIQALKEIVSRGKVPVFSGGTAFYFKALLNGIPETPPSDPDIRKALENRLEKVGLDSLYLELAKLDPEYARKISNGDPQRILRALEIIKISGKKVSEHKIIPILPTEYQPILIAMDRPREELYHRINQRVDAMLSSGLEEEVSKLISQGYDFEDPGLSGIGYREWKDYFTGAQSLGKVIDKIKTNSRRYAKRQLTFFRALPDVKWISAENSKELGQIIGDFLDIDQEL